MKNNSDESDYENGSFKNFSQDNDGSVETKEPYSSYFSCSNDSDGNEDYSNESTSEKDNIATFKSHNVYQEFSYEQDSADEGCSRNMQNHVYVQDLSNCNGGLETRTKRKTYEEDPYHHSKRQKIHRSSSKSDEEDIDEKRVHNTGKEVITQESKNAAVKMENIDRACNFMFTKPEGLGDNELLYFADVCAGPGGLSEYVLWQNKWHAKGFGLTLNNENDFKLADFYAGPCETFHPYYGPKENGDVFDPDNQEAFTNLIMQHTHGKGVYFMMSDGGFSVEGQENIQEIHLKPLKFYQCLIALMITRETGHFVTKLFDLFTPFSAGLLYLSYLVI